MSTPPLTRASRALADAFTPRQHRFALTEEELKRKAEIVETLLADSRRREAALRRANHWKADRSAGSVSPARHETDG